MHSNSSLPEETVALAAAVSRLLASQDYESAVFVGERLVAAVPQDEAARALLGEAYLRGGGGAAGGGPAAASALLRGCKSPACRFLAARAAMAREAWSEVEDSLLRGTGLAGADIATLRSSLLATGGELRLPRGAAAVALLALAAARTDRLVRAADLYKLALELDPFQWSCYEALCRLGQAPPAMTVFRPRGGWPLGQPPTASDENSTPTPKAPVQRGSPAVVSIAPAAEASAPPPPPRGRGGAGNLHKFMFAPAHALDDVAAEPSPVTPAMRLALGTPMIGGGALFGDASGIAANVSATASAAGAGVTLTMSATGGSVPWSAHSHAMHLDHASTPVQPPAAVTGAAADGSSLGSAIGLSLGSAMQFSDPDGLRTWRPAGDGGAASGSAAGDLLATPAMVAGASAASAAVAARLPFSEVADMSTAPATAVQQPAANASGPPASAVPASGGAAPLYLGAAFSAVPTSGAAVSAAAAPVRMPAGGRGGRLAGGRALFANSSGPPPPHHSALGVRDMPSYHAAASAVATSVAAATAVQGGRAWPAAEATPAASTVVSPASEGAALAVLARFGEATSAQAQCWLAGVMAALSALPRAQAASAGAHALLGRAHLEAGAHAAAAAAFERARELAPARLADADAHSTALWHLRAEAPLDALAAACLAADCHSPTTLVVAANALSLRRDHAGALAYLQRACAIAPRYAYAHTLAGHEQLALGDLDAAKTSFRTALRYDSRHYNALFGYGAAAVREEKFAPAEVYFRKALEVNSRSAVLHCHLAMALTAQGRHSEALAVLDRAASIAPGLAQVAYQKASVFLATGELTSAEAELRKVLEQAPREPTVLVQIGKVCKSLDKKAEAMTFLQAALANTKGDRDAALIKHLISSLTDDDAEYDGVVF